MKTKALWFSLGVIVLLALGGWAYLSLNNDFYETPLPTTDQSTQKADAKVPEFSHIITIVFENKGYSTIMSGDQAPYFQKLAKENALATNYSANFHPSLPNYIAMTSGTNAGITSDCAPTSCPAKTKPVVDEIEQSGRSWKAYFESMPEPCYRRNSGNYAVRHNPFVYYPSVYKNQSRCQSHDVPFGELAKDLAADQLPDYAFIAPNLCSDMHDCSVQTGNDWLAEKAPKIMNSDAFKNTNSLLIITFDEAEIDGEDNRIPTILIGSSVKNQFTSDQFYSHYSLLHTVESAWQLQSLTDNDTKAPIMDDFFKS